MKENSINKIHKNNIKLHEIQCNKFSATVEPMGAFIRVIVYNTQGHGHTTLMLPKESAEQFSKAFNDCI